MVAFVGDPTVVVVIVAVFAVVPLPVLVSVTRDVVLAEDVATIIGFLSSSAGDTLRSLGSESSCVLLGDEQLTSLSMLGDAVALRSGDGDSSCWEWMVAARSSFRRSCRPG